MFKSRKLQETSAEKPLQHVLLNGDRLAYNLYGSGREKAFFFHGFPGGRHQGALIQRYCDEFDLQVAAFDRPGYGYSEFANLPKGYNALADVLEAVSEAWGWKRVQLLAVSGGTPYALAWASRSSRVASLHTVCGLGPLSDEAFRSKFSTTFMRLMSTAHITPEFALNALLRKALGDGEGATFAGQNISGFLMQSHMRDALRQGARGAKLDLANYLTAKDIEWSTIRCPMNIWHGTSDTVVPSYFAEIMKTRIPHAELRLKPNECHYSLPFLHARTILGEIQRWAEKRPDESAVI